MGQSLAQIDAENTDASEIDVFHHWKLLKSGIQLFQHRPDWSVSMRILFVRWISTLLLITIGSQPALARTDMAGSHVVTLELTSDGTVIGRPQFVMKPGDTVEAKRETPDGYSIKVTLKDPAGSGSPGSVVDMQLYLPGDAGWVLAAHPFIHVGLNEISDLSFRTETGKTIGIRLSVKKNA